MAKKTLKKFNLKKRTKNYRKKTKLTKKRHIRGSGPFDRGAQALSKTLGRQTIGIGKEYLKSVAQDETVGKQTLSRKLSNVKPILANVNYDYDYDQENINPNTYKYKLNTSTLGPSSIVKLR